MSDSPKKFFPQFLLIFFLFLLFSSPICLAKNVVWIKYRTTPVDLDRSYFDYQDTSESSWVRGAWYDSTNKYLVINLSGTYYSYCAVPGVIWNKFKDYDSHGSFGRAYNYFLKGNYSCSGFKVPEY